MTSLAFVMGVLPLVLSTGAGSEMRQAMGVAVFAGMIGVTAFGLFLTPVFYVLLRAPDRQPAAAPARQVPLEGCRRRRRRCARRLVPAAPAARLTESEHVPRDSCSPGRGALLLAGCATALPELPRSPPPAQFKEGGALDRRAARRSAGPRRLVAGLQRPGAGRAGGARHRAATPASRKPRRGWRRPARWCAAPMPTACRRSASAPARRGRPAPTPRRQPRRRRCCRPAPAFSYEADLFGRLAGQRRRRAGCAGARGAAAKHALLVQAEVAQTYLALRALDAERALVRETVGRLRDTLRLTQRRYQAGDVAELDVVRVQTEVAATEAEALALDRQRAAAGARARRAGGRCGFGASGWPAAHWTTALPVIPGRRARARCWRAGPMCRRAQASLLAAQARVGVAQAAWFPSACR
jgi:multidrug efflux system outer membrane protein